MGAGRRSHGSPILSTKAPERVKIFKSYMKRANKKVYKVPYSEASRFKVYIRKGSLYLWVVPCANPIYVIENKGSGRF